MLQATGVCAEVLIHIMWGHGGESLAIPSCASVTGVRWDMVKSPLPFSACFLLLFSQAQAPGARVLSGKASS